MNLFQVLFLAIVQGLTEFLPVSSSGHLALFQNFFNLSKTPILFDILLHVGTLFSIIFYFRREIFKEPLKIWLLVLIGTLPVALIGFLFQDKIESAFTSLTAIGFSFLITAFLLFSTKLIKKINEPKKVNPKSAFLIGLFQAVSLLPGVSRSGATIVGGLWQKFTPIEAFKFSLYLAIPAILGAMILKIKDFNTFSQGDFLYGVLGMIISAVVGFLSLIILQRILKEAKIFWFGFYCLVLGVVILLL